MRTPEDGIRRELHTADDHQRVQQLVDSGLAQLGERRMRGAADRTQPHAQRPAGRKPKTVIRRLAVDQELDARWRLLVRALGAVAPPLLADDVEQADPLLAAAPQP